MFCKKALIDETLPICLRCRLTKIDFVKHVGGGLLAVGGALIAFGNTQNNTDDSIDTDYYDDNEDT